ncbi:COG4705 family protein [Tsukamurella soli]|uniref:Membrane protein n=1 Tax=Tsukamurella soli TaxID=644556 RepID=A0ABP8JT01_9ACTN
MTRVPEITARFWVIRTMFTAACVFWPDYLFDHLGRVVTTAGIVLALATALVVQLRAAQYRPWRFWVAMLAVGVAGTEAANGPHVLGMSYPIVAMVWMLILVALVVGWQATAGTVSLRRVDSAARERCFWACALAAGAVGTAVTHMTPPLLITCPGVQVLLWAGAVGGLAFAYRRTAWVSAATFWCGFVLTRPLGTGCAFLVSAPHHGLGLGPASTTGLFAVVSLLVIGVPAVARSR